MKVSKKTDYALRALFAIAEADNLIGELNAMIELEHNRFHASAISCERRTKETLTEALQRVRHQRPLTRNMKSVLEKYKMDLSKDSNHTAQEINSYCARVKQTPTLTGWNLD